MNRLIPLLPCWLLVTLVSCTKENLQEPAHNRYAVPRTLEDLQQFLDHEDLFGRTPSAGIESAGEFFVKDTFFSRMSGINLSTYSWHQEPYDGAGIDYDWKTSYEQVFYTNQVLERLNTIKDQRPLYQVVKGSAYFMRAYAFYHLSQLYAPPYDAGVPGSPYGIPLPLTGDVHAPVVRSTVGDTYGQILDDLALAEGLLPAGRDADQLNRPTKASVLALLARVYLAMRRYADAGKAADQALQLHDALIDYQTVDTNAVTLFAANNAETLYQSSTGADTYPVAGFRTVMAGVDSLLYRQYEPGDLRRTVFFRWDTVQQVAVLRSSYYGASFFGTHLLFTGLTTAELFLIRAECRARAQAVAPALDDLNTLRAKRWRTTEFTPLHTTDAQELLQWIWQERQKELVLRGLRWGDLRRLHLEPDGPKVTLTRFYKGQLLCLPPNDLRYTLPLPPKVVSQHRLLQNPR